MLTNEDFNRLSNMLDEKLEKTLDQKLYEKLDEKLGYMMQTIDQKFDAQAKMFDAKLGLLEYNFKEEIRKVNVRIDMLDEKLTNKIEEVDARLSARMDKLEKRIDNMDGRFSTRFDNLEDKVTSMDRTIRHDIVPQLATVSSICAEAMEKYIKTADKIEYVQADVEMLKRVTADHHEQLKKLNKSKQ